MAVKENKYEPWSMSRRSLLTNGLTSVAAVTLTQFLRAPSASAQEASSPASLVSGPLTLNGILVETEISPLRNRFPFLLFTERATGFQPIYVRGRRRTLQHFVGSTVAITGQLTNVAPTLSLIANGPVFPIAPTPVPDFEQTLEDIPLTPDEEATVQELIRTFINALFDNPDPVTNQIIRDQLAQALIHPEIASATATVPFAVWEDPETGPVGVSLGQLVRLIDALPETDSSEIQPLHTDEQKLLRLVIAIFGAIIGILGVRIGVKLGAKIKAVAKRILGSESFRFAITSIFEAILSFINGTLSMETLINTVLRNIKSIGGELGSGVLDVLKSLKWWEYVIAIGKMALGILKIVTLIISVGAFLFELFEIVRDP